ncbi:hypothetical protein HZF08_35725 [Paenibacillus sp. CGMCC 1.16610]|uniref:Uncharacterized protein n=1 Tax=Paenibacillus anseongense TaxID=2682845 RepID=A0ABW9TZD4_9BACL|nr:MULTISPECIES: hypothetical protein [Paenibacillus]MBA2943627.1 hypothetical protein [Paenibacillus sp. CGMCC 1.16610]MVQ33123.1 hypothetical protein [Paenibacillus anseongense]
MKKKLLYVSAVIIFLYVTAVSTYQIVPAIKGRSAATHFLETLMLEKDGLSLVDYRNLRVNLSDNALEGSVYVTLKNQSVKKEYRIFLTFGGGRWSPKISHLQYIEADGVDETIEQWIRTINSTLS